MTSGDVPGSSRPKRLRWLPWRTAKDVDRERLDAALREFRHRKERLASEVGGSPTVASEWVTAQPTQPDDTGESRLAPSVESAKPSWLAAAERLERAAHESSEAGAFNSAWSLLKAANRELHDAYTPDELLVEAQVTALEAEEKLASWRKKAVTHLLERYLKVSSPADEVQPRPSTKGEITPDDAEPDHCPQDGDDEGRSNQPGIDPLLLRVARARSIADEAADNTYIKQDLFRIQLRNSTVELVTSVAVTVLVVFLAVNSGWQLEETSNVLQEPWSLGIVLTLGALSAALSGLMSLLRADESRRIPAVKLQGPLLIIRPFIGAVAALIVVAILQSGLGGLNVDPEAALLAAFVAGFSEKVVSRAVASAEASIAGD